MKIHSTETYTARNDGVTWEVYLEYVGYNGQNVSGRSSKFYEIGSNGQGYYTKYGKIGTGGKMTTMTYHDAVEKMEQKLSKGYDNTVGPGTYAASKQPAPAPTPTPAPTTVEIQIPEFTSVTLTSIGSAKIACIKAVRQLLKDGGQPSGLREAKQLVETVQNGTPTQVVSFCTQSQAFNFASQVLSGGGALACEEAPEERNVDHSAYAMFATVARIRREGDSWRGVDAEGYKLMKIPQSVLSL